MCSALLHFQNWKYFLDFPLNVLWFPRNDNQAMVSVQVCPPLRCYAGLILSLCPETALLCNHVSHWLNANLESALLCNPVMTRVPFYHKQNSHYNPNFNDLITTEVVHLLCGPYWQCATQGSLFEPRFLNQGCIVDKISLAKGIFLFWSP